MEVHTAIKKVLPAQVIKLGNAQEAIDGFAWLGVPKFY